MTPADQNEQDAGTRIWVRLNGTEAPFLDDDAASLAGYQEFQELTTDTSRELVNEAIQGLMQIWLAASNRVNSEHLSGGTVSASLKRLNRVARKKSPIVEWEELMRGLLSDGRSLPGKVSGLLYETAEGLALPGHTHKVNVRLHFQPDGSEDRIGLAVIWSDLGDGAGAALDSSIFDLPTAADVSHPSWGSVRAFFGPAGSKAIEEATDWLSLLEKNGHEFVFSQCFPVVQRLEVAAQAGVPTGGDLVIWNRVDGVRRSAVARLNLWAGEYYPEAPG